MKLGQVSEKSQANKEKVTGFIFLFRERINGHRGPI
jgi:hypothetical protein